MCVILVALNAERPRGPHPTSVARITHTYIIILTVTVIGEAAGPLYTFTVGIFKNSSHFQYKLLEPGSFESTRCSKTLSIV